jgi:hypothetical protein
MIELAHYCLCCHIITIFGTDTAFPHCCSRCGNVLRTDRPTDSSVNLLDVVRLPKVKGRAMRSASRAGYKIDGRWAAAREIPTEKAPSRPTRLRAASA